ncbi:MAG: PAS domain S-box protein [Alphaproteobacteria bacterium]|nr:PAS domain S-box protein [Alphaproteobacteria bacterium]
MPSPDLVSTSLSEADHEVLFRTVINTAVDGIIVIDEAGRMLLFNRAAENLFGYTPPEVLGRNVDMLMPEPYRSRHDSFLQRYMTTGEKRIIGIGREVTAQRKDGSTFPMYLSVGEGRVRGMRVFLGIIHDLTDRTSRERDFQELQNELLHALRLTAMGQLTSALAHELNQPLTAVMNYLNAARRTLDAGGEQAIGRVREFMDKAVSQTQRAGQIIRRLRNFIEKRDSDRQLEDLNSCVEEAIALGLVGAPDRDVRITTELANDLPPVMIDRIQLQQVMINLMRNAVEALESATERKILIRTQRPAPDFVQVSVTDSGPGIPPDIVSNLFIPFSTTKAKGLGMGLTICKAIIEAHNGRIWVAAPKGGGAEFAFRLPVVEETQA